jgi:hypothetical protein
MGLRLYNAATGRFLQTDPINGGSCNAYEYACGNPVTGSDLTGCTCAIAKGQIYLTAGQQQWHTVSAAAWNTSGWQRSWATFETSRIGFYVFIAGLGTITFGLGFVLGILSIDDTLVQSRWRIERQERCTTKTNFFRTKITDPLYKVVTQVRMMWVTDVRGKIVFGSLLGGSKTWTGAWSRQSAVQFW